MLLLILHTGSSYEHSLLSKKHQLAHIRSPDTTHDCDQSHSYIHTSTCFHDKHTRTLRLTIYLSTFLHVVSPRSINNTCIIRNHTAFTVQIQQGLTNHAACACDVFLPPDDPHLRILTLYSLHTPSPHIFAYRHASNDTVNH